MVVALLALFIALGGVSYGVATGSIDSREIKDGGVRGRDVGDGALRGVDVRNNSLGGGDIADGTLRGREVAVGAIRSGERRLAMPGRYELEARTVPRAVFEAIDVAPGQERIVRREGLSRIEIVPPAGSEATYRLDVLTPAGERLGDVSGSQPALPAWPGEYLARVWRGRDLVWEGRVAVASDKTARIDLTGP